MDNVKYYNDSLAHDFNMFMPSAEEKPLNNDNVINMPRRNKKSSVKAHAVNKSKVHAFPAFMVIFILAIVCCNIYLRAQITSVNSAADQFDQKIATIESENVRLNVELERKISYNNIEAEAEKLGMQKAQRNQIVYVRTNTDTSDEKYTADASVE